MSIHLCRWKKGMASRVAPGKVQQTLRAGFVHFLKPPLKKKVTGTSVENMSRIPSKNGVKTRTLGLHFS